MTKAGQKRPIPTLWRRFADGLLLGKTQHEAYIDAGYSPRGAKQGASRLLTNVNFSAYFQGRSEKIRKQVDEYATKTKADVIRRLEAIGFADPGDFVEITPAGIKFKSSEDLTPAQRSVLASISYTETKHGSSKKISFRNPIDALEKLARMQGWFEKETDNKEVVVRIETFSKDESG